MAKPKMSLTQELAPRSRSIDFYGIGNLLLPNPDPVLKKQGRDISIYQELLTDDRVAGGMINRTAASKALLWEIDREQAPARQHQALQDIFNRLPMNRIMEQILKARAFGFAPIEVMWALRDGLTVPVELVLKPQPWFLFDQENILKFRSRQNYMVGEELPPCKFLCPTNEADYANPYGLGLLSRCFWPVTFKRGGWKFWTTFAERFGQVWPIGKLPRTATEKQTTDLLDVLDRMLQDGSAVIPDDGSIELLESGTKGGTSDLFRGIIAEANTAISTVWLGHAGGGESTPGKLGGESLATDVRDDLRDDDANLIMETLQQLLDWTCEVNWPVGANNYSPRRTPTFNLREQDQIDISQAERDDKLTTAMERSGLQLTSVYYRKTYGLEEEDISVGAAFMTPANQGPQGAMTAAPGATPARQGAINLAPTAAVPATFAEGQSDIISRLVAQAGARLDPITGAWLNALKNIVEHAESLEELRDSILTAYPDLPVNEVARIMAEETLRANMAGRMEGKAEG